MRIGVLSHTDKVGRDKPVRHIARCSALRWLSLGTHRPVDKFTIQEIDPALVGKQRRMVHIPSPPPEKLEPAELPGISFQFADRRAFAQTPQLQRIRQYA